jgi:hypothetical protein
MPDRSCIKHANLKVGVPSVPSLGLPSVYSVRTKVLALSERRVLQSAKIALLTKGTEEDKNSKNEEFLPRLTRLG